jgi:serine acetyltransferase
MVGGAEDAFFTNSEEIDPIGCGGTVGAGAEVTRDAAAAGTVGGVPAQVIDSGPLPGDGS